MFLAWPKDRNYHTWQTANSNLTVLNQDISASVFDKRKSLTGPLILIVLSDEVHRTYMDQNLEQCRFPRLTRELWHLLLPHLHVGSVSLVASTGKLSS